MARSLFLLLNFAAFVSRLPPIAALSPPSLIASRSLSSDDTYDRIQALRKEPIPFSCHVSVLHLVVWCDIVVPPDLNVAAEIRDGTCEDFDVPASGKFYRDGLATPFLKPEITEEEREAGTFAHKYCARVDVYYAEDGLENKDDGNGGGVGPMVSVLERRHPIEITYRMRNDVTEELSSAALSDASTKAEGRNSELLIGLGAVAGAVVTLSLAAIFYGGAKRATREGWRRREAEASEEEEGEGMVEIAPAAGSNDNENEII
ncbi:hypothetical protein ACHAWF_007967 [Thalassiosira exigua]